MTIGRGVLVAAVCAATYTGCLRRGERPRDSGPPVDYVRRSFESSLAGCNDEHGVPVACVRLQIEYVEATRATVELAHAVARFVGAAALGPVGDSERPENVEALREDLYASYRELQENLPNYRVHWELQRRVTVACNTDDVQGLTAAEHSFMGGTRPIDRVRYATFDTQTGERLGLEALVAPEQHEQLLGELAERRRGAVSGGDTWSRGKGGPAARAGPPDSVLMCPDVLTFRWDDGVEVVVPRDELRGLLRTDAP